MSQQTQRPNNNSCLPAEILNIIIHTSVFSQDDFWARTRTVVRLLLLCKTWKWAALADARLWTSFDCRHYRGLPLLQKRSHGLPMAVQIRLFTFDRSEHDWRVVDAFSQLLWQARRFKFNELRASFSDTAWKTYQISHILAVSQADLSSLERFDCTIHDRPSEEHCQEVSRKWFAYGASLPPLKHLHLANCFMDWEEVMKLRLEELCIDSPYIPHMVRDSVPGWRNVLEALAPTLRKLRLVSSNLQTVLICGNPIKLSLLQSLDLSYYEANDSIVSFMDAVHLPVDCDVQLRIHHYESYNIRLAALVNNFLGRRTAPPEYRLEYHRGRLLIVPLVGYGLFSIRCGADFFPSAVVSCMSDLRPEFESAIRELQMDNLDTRHVREYGWPARHLPAVRAITFAGRLDETSPGLPEFGFREQIPEGKELRYSLVDVVASANYKLFPELTTLNLCGLRLDDPRTDRHRVLAAARKCAQHQQPLTSIYLDKCCIITSNFRAALAEVSPFTSVILEGKEVVDIFDSPEDWTSCGSASQS